jgi:hypothetical protein
MTWKPPDDPDPTAILHSAESDTRDGSHAQALAKFLWFHHNALRHDSAIYGVRLSFALSSWLELASLHPPARAALIRARDETEAAFRREPSSFELFHDLAALNRHLGDGPRTVDLFVSTAHADYAAAERLYRVAEPFLIAVGRYDACGPFLDPPKRMRRAAEAYQMMTRTEEARPADERAPPPLARSFYVHDVATLVGLLFLNRRLEEATEARAQGLTVLDNEEFRALLAAAMSGHLPPASVRLTC